MNRITLKSSWLFRQSPDGNRWLKTRVPGNIHLDLLNNEIIPDPYYRLNEHDQQWIGEADWEYKTSFDISPDYFKNAQIDIVFEGLDTYADVYVNNRLILVTDNMYCRWRKGIKDYLKTGNNELRIYFHSVIKETLPLYNKNGFIYGANNSQPEPKLSVYSRKPGYHYGWDWGPRLLTCGIWRPVYLEAWNKVRLGDVRFIQKSLSDKLAQLQLEAEVISSEDTKVDLVLSGKSNAFRKIKIKSEVQKGTSTIIIGFDINNPQKWWCNGLGEQHLYELNLELFHNGTITGIWHEKVGLRTIELVHEKDGYGKSFYFRINGIPVFIKGANCLPVDYFIPRVKKKDYINFLKNAVDTNMNMLRLWGGAIYEENIFYEICDELGILVWQDFMFACAIYPADEIMQVRICQEAEDNIKRLRNHACLALWCGNNEIDEGWHQWGWQELYNYSEETCKQIWKYYKIIFHKILPDKVKKYDPERTYWPSSPKYGFPDIKSRSDGDMHYWGVWFLNHSREGFKEYLPRFMSEYGLQSMPELKTFHEFALHEDLNLKSDVMLAHQRQYPNLKKGQKLGGYDMMLKYLENEFCVPDNFELLAYTSQLLQAEYLKYAIETHRRNKPYCMGTMYWQLNDLWPATSWSTIDYYGRWKAANYMVKKAYEPVLVSTDYHDGKLMVYIVNDMQTGFNIQLLMKLMTFYGDILYEKNMEVKVEPDSSKPVFEINSDAIILEHNVSELVWITALCRQNKTVSENLFYFTNTNKLKLEEPEIDFTIKKKKNEYMIRINAKKLAKNIKINTSNTEGNLSDNYFDLLSGEEKVVIFKHEKKWDEKFEFIHYYNVQKNAAHH